MDDEERGRSAFRRKLYILCSASVHQTARNNRQDRRRERMYVFSLPSTPVARPSAIIFRGSKFYKTWRGTLRTPLFFFFFAFLSGKIYAQGAAARVFSYTRLSRKTNEIAVWMRQQFVDGSVDQQCTICVHTWKQQMHARTEFCLAMAYI